MKEARGKIIFLRRFNLTKNYDSSVERAMGFNLTNWDDINIKIINMRTSYMMMEKIMCIFRMHIIHMEVRSGRIY